MSIKIMTAVWEHSQATGTDRLVLLALADIADDNGECWPSVAHIARKCRIDPRTTQRRIRSLQKLGEVIVVVGGGKSRTAGGTRSNRYRIVVHLPDEKEGGDLPPHGTDARGGVAQTPGGGVAQTPPEPSLLTVNEPSLVPASPKSRNHRIPDDFAVTHEMRQWCTSQNIRSDPMTQTERFVDHYKSTGVTKANWNACWRNWMRKADEWAKPSADKRSKSMQNVDNILNPFEVNGVPQPGYWDQTIEATAALTAGDA